MRPFAALLALSSIALALTAAGTAATRGAVQLTGTVGPGFTITLKNHGKTVKTLAPATYSFVIYDKSSIHNFHLRGPGVNKMTSVGKTGTSHWTLTLRQGKYTFVCDPHASIMKGSFVVKAP